MVVFDSLGFSYGLSVKPCYAQKGRHPMKRETVLKSLVILEWCLVPVSLLAQMLLVSHLPEELQDYVAYVEWAEGPFDAFLFLGGLAGLALLVLWLVSTVGLFLIRRWAMRYYIVSIVGMALLCSVAGPSVDHGVSAAIGLLATLNHGMIVSLCLWGFLMPMNEAHNHGVERAQGA